MNRATTVLLLGAYVGSIYAANWLLLNVGTPTVGGVHTIPVWPGIEAPSGVLAAGATFTLRDGVQRVAGISASLTAIVCGTLLSALISPTLALASGVSFFLAEFLDLIVYTPLRNQFTFAVVASNVVGAIVDSFVFLTVAFGWSVAMGLALPSVLGKLEASLVTLGILALLRFPSIGSEAKGRLGKPTR